MMPLHYVRCDTTDTSAYILGTSRDISHRAPYTSAHAREEREIY